MIHTYEPCHLPGVFINGPSFSPSTRDKILKYICSSFHRIERPQMTLRRGENVENRKCRRE